MTEFSVIYLVVQIEVKMLTVNQKYVKTMIFLAATMMISMLYAGEYDNIFNSLWLGNVPKIEKKGWRQSGNVLKTFDMTDRQVADILKSHGFSEKNHSETKKNMKRCKISLWRKTDYQIIVMLVEQEIGKTLFSWGVINDAK